MYLHRQAQVVNWTLYAFCLALVSSQLIYAFVGLDASSLWIDELWTGWLVLPSDGPGILARSVTDVHPPLYYLAVHLWTMLFGPTDIVMRSFSAACAALTIVALVALAPRWIGVAGRLFAGAIAATSPQWLEQSQNARMYALGFLLGLWLVLTALRALSEARGEHGIRTSTFVALTLSAFAFSFCHFYMFVASIGVLVFLTAAAPRWPDRFRFAAIGVLLFACMLAFIVVLLGHTEIAIQDTWFSNSPAAIVDMTVRGITKQVRLLPLAVLFILLGAATILPRFQRADAGADRATMPPLSLFMMLFVVAFVIIAGIVSSLVVAPSYSDRNVAVAAPFAWLGVAILVDHAVKTLPRWASSALLTILAASIALHGLEQWQRLRPNRTEYRAASSYIRALPECVSQPIAVMLKTDEPEKAAAGGFTAYRFGHYLPGYPLAGIGYRRNRLSLDGGTRQMLARRASGVDRCPVLAMIADTSGFDIAHFSAALRSAITDAASKTQALPDRFVIVPFSHYDVYGNRLDEAWIVRRH
jgi:uncharacterized membrane protein